MKTIVYVTALLLASSLLSLSAVAHGRMLNPLAALMNMDIDMDKLGGPAALNHFMMNPFGLHPHPPHPHHQVRNRWSSEDLIDHQIQHWICAKTCRNFEKQGLEYAQEVITYNHESVTPSRSLDSTKAVTDQQSSASPSSSSHHMVKIAFPGKLSLDEIHLSMYGDVLNIDAERVIELSEDDTKKMKECGCVPPSNKQVYHRQIQFSRPNEAEIDANIEYSKENNYTLLTVRVPQAKAQKRKVEIKIGGGQQLAAEAEATAAEKKATRQDQQESTIKASQEKVEELIEL